MESATQTTTPRCLYPSDGVTRGSEGRGASCVGRPDIGPQIDIEAAEWADRVSPWPAGDAVTCINGTP